MVAECSLDRGNIALVLVEQSIQANGRIVFGRAAEWTKARAGVKARFTHRSITQIKTRRQLHSVEARLQAVGAVSTTRVRRCASRLEVVGWRLLRVRPQPANNVEIVRAVVGHFGHWTVAKIEVAGEARVACKMRRSCP